MTNALAQGVIGCSCVPVFIRKKRNLEKYWGVHEIEMDLLIGIFRVRIKKLPSAKRTACYFRPQNSVWKCTNPIEDYIALLASFLLTTGTMETKHMVQNNNLVLAYTIFFRELKDSQNNQCLKSNKIKIDSLVSNCILPHMPHSNGGAFLSSTYRSNACKTRFLQENLWNCTM